MVRTMVQVQNDVVKLLRTIKSIPMKRVRNDSVKLLLTIQLNLLKVVLSERTVLHAKVHASRREKHFSAARPVLLRLRERGRSRRCERGYVRQLVLQCVSTTALSRLTRQESYD